MLPVEAVMLLELLHVIRRWPSVAAAIAIHFMVVGMILLTPTPEGISVIACGPLPLPHPPPRPPGCHSPRGRPSPHGDKHFDKKPPATMEPPTTVPEEPGVDPV